MLRFRTRSLSVQDVLYHGGSWNSLKGVREEVADLPMSVVQAYLPQIAHCPNPFPDWAEVPRSSV